MKLRNKKTGEIVEPFGITCVNGRTFVQFDDGKGTFKFEARSLVDLNEMCEDYEEPKEYWYIDDAGVIQIDQVLTSEINMRKSIGNYFSSKEEAEKAVEKMKAWKRLKDKGFKLNAVLGDSFFCLDIFMRDESYEKIKDDLKIVFGGKE